MKSEYDVGKGKIEVVQGSVTRYFADALVCPANGDLEPVMFPGNVQYAFFVDGGEGPFIEARQIRKSFEKPLPYLSANITTAGNLPSKYVIHSVAVRLNEKSGELYCDSEVIGAGTRNALEVAREAKLKSIGFPALGTGLYAVPLEEVVESMGDEFALHLMQEDTSLERLGLVLYSPEQYGVGKQILDKKFR